MPHRCDVWKVEGFTYISKSDSAHRNARVALLNAAGEAPGRYQIHDGKGNVVYELVVYAPNQPREDSE